MKTSSRGTPLSFNARPTLSSLPYAWAVSMWRYPSSRAHRTELTVVGPFGICHTPRPSSGIWFSSASVRSCLSKLWVSQPGSAPALGCQRDQAEGDDAQAVHHSRDMQTKYCGGEPGGNRREAEGQVGHEEGDGQELTALAGRCDAGQRPEGGQSGRSETHAGDDGPDRGQSQDVAFDAGERQPSPARKQGGSDCQNPAGRPCSGQEGGEGARAAQQRHDQPADQVVLQAKQADRARRPEREGQPPSGQAGHRD